jgi:Family of unknown function (DUF6941)
MKLAERECVRSVILASDSCDNLVKAESLVVPNPEVMALLTCDAAALDPVGKVTLYGLFDVINTKQVPARHPSFSVFCKCRFSAPGEVKLAIHKPDGSLLTQGNLDPVRAQVPGVAQAVYNFAGLEFPVAGEYQVRVSGTGGVIAQVPLTVQITQ